MTAVVVRGDAARLPLPDGSVDLIVTSPPYWQMRSYTDGGEHYDGQIGSEETPGEYLEALWRCTREWMRVLKPEGSIFVDLGDKYATRYSSTRSRGRAGLNGDDDTRGRSGQNRTGAGEKSLLLLPERYRIGCADQLGLIAREVIEWHKPNPLPESVKDRCGRAHEDVVHLVRQPRYYSALDEIREPQLSVGRRHEGRSGWAGAPPGIARGFQKRALSPLGKIPGSVWTIQLQPLQMPAHLTDDEHYAAFPMELPRRIILAWSPPGICIACGEGRRPVTVKSRARSRPVIGNTYGGPGRKPNTGDREPSLAVITGYACACPDVSAPTQPAVVLDPFGGTGTSALVADMLGRTGVTIDRSAGYCRRARWRTTDPGERARALGVKKPPPVSEGQGALFGRDGEVVA